ncbi:hypothetical protein GCM10022380_88350 [Amycolatopsis tucumanensis]|uniref:Uncharacterized protein n=1 Tax=Amycolatopsis tucumanensis TaxID=401106 RepID=A0ABP7JX96_9PSEU
MTDERDEVTPADHVVQVPQLDHALFQLAGQAGADTAPGRRMTPNQGVGDQLFVRDPFRVVQAAVQVATETFRARE